MIRDNDIIAILGPNRSSHAIPVSEVAQQHGVPMVTTTATNPAVTSAGDFVFMAAFTDSLSKVPSWHSLLLEELGIDIYRCCTHAEAAKSLYGGHLRILPDTTSPTQGGTIVGKCVL